MEIFGEGFDGVLIFCGVTWTPLVKYGIFELCGGALETRSLRGVGFTVSIYGLALAGTGPSLLLHFVLLPMVMLLILMHFLP